MRLVFNAIQLRPRMAGVRTLAGGLLQGIQNAAGESKNELELIVVTTALGQDALEQAGVDIGQLSRNHRLVLLPSWCARSGAALMTTIVVLPIISAWFRATAILSYDYMSPIFSTAKRITVVTDLRLQELRKIKLRPFPVLIRSICNLANSRFADSVIAISEHSAAEFTSVYGNHGGNVAAIPLGVHPKERRTVSPSPGQIATIGTTHLHKRFATLVQAAAILAERGLVFQVHHYGFDGDQDSELKRLVVDEGLEGQFHFHGHVDAKTLDLALQSASIYVATSEYEGFGLTPAEAASHGVTVVASDIPAHRAAVPSADFFPVGDCKALATVLGRCLDNQQHSPPERSAIRSWTNVGQEYIDLIDSTTADVS